MPPTVQGYRLYSALHEVRVSLNQLKVGVERKNDPFHRLTIAISMPAFYDTRQPAVATMKL